MTFVARREPNPFEIIIVLAALVFGSVLLVAPHALKSTITRVLPAWEVFGFGGVLVVGSVITLLGAWWHEPEGLRYEAVGCALTGLFMMIFAFLVIKDTGLSSASIFFFALSLGFLWRTWQISVALRRTAEAADKVARAKGEL